MNHLTLLVGTLTLATSSPAAGQAPANDRVAAILEHAQARLEQQNDIWFEDGEFPKIIQSLRIQFEMRPDDYEVATNLGWMQTNVEDEPAAIQTYTTYLKRNPQDSDAALPLAQLHYMKKRYAPVPALLEPAIARAKVPHANAFRILAHSYERTGQLEKSRATWLRFLKVSPDDGPAKVNLKRVEGKIAKK